MSDPPIAVDYFSDVLCVWAYVAQARLEELERRFPDEVRVSLRCCPVFGDTATRIGKGWEDRGGYEGFGDHVREVCGRFEHTRVHGDVWRRTRPVSSEPAHLWLKALQLVEGAGDAAPGTAAAFSWKVRRAFFEECRDVASAAVLRELADALGAPAAALRAAMDDGTAFAALAADHHDRERLRIEGSPSFVLDGGRQKLYGNVGYRIIEANVRELLRAPEAGSASWC